MSIEDFGVLVDDIKEFTRNYRKTLSSGMVRSNLYFDQVSFHVQIYRKARRGKSGWTDESGLKPGLYQQQAYHE